MIFKKVQEDSRMFKQVEEGSIIKGAIGFHRILTGSRRFKKVQEGSRRLKKVQECSRMQQKNVVAWKTCQILQFMKLRVFSTYRSVLSSVIPSVSPKGKNMHQRRLVIQ